jgi:hypothetical protein
MPNYPSLWLLANKFSSNNPWIRQVMSSKLQVIKKHHRALLCHPNVYSISSRAANAALIQEATIPHGPAVVLRIPQVLSSLPFVNFPSGLHGGYARGHRRTLPCGCATTLTDTNISPILPQSTFTLLALSRILNGSSNTPCMWKASSLHDFKPDKPYLHFLSSSVLLALTHHTALLQPTINLRKAVHDARRGVSRVTFAVLSCQVLG